jgi:hypothetical protein
MQHGRMTRHARQRLQQRGARPKELAIVMTYGDIEIPAQDGCHFVRLSHQAAAQLLDRGGAEVQDIDRAKRLMVLADASGRVITVIKGYPERRDRVPTRQRGPR